MNKTSLKVKANSMNSYTWWFLLFIACAVAIPLAILLGAFQLYNMGIHLNVPPFFESRSTGLADHVAHTIAFGLVVGISIYTATLVWFQYKKHVPNILPLVISAFLEFVLGVTGLAIFPILNTAGELNNVLFWLVQISVFGFLVRGYVSAERNKGGHAPVDTKKSKLAYFLTLTMGAIISVGLITATLTVVFTPKSIESHIEKYSGAQRQAGEAALRYKHSSYGRDALVVGSKILSIESVSNTQQCQADFQSNVNATPTLRQVYKVSLEDVKLFGFASQGEVLVCEY